MSAVIVKTTASRRHRNARPSGARSTLLARLVWSEARRSGVIWLLPLLVVSGAWFALEYSRVDLLFWDQVSANIALTFALVGPVCSAWGAALASREERRRLTELVAVTSTTALRRELVTLGTPVIGAMVAYALIALVVGGYTATYATWGGPSWSVIAFGALVIVAMTMCGVAIGRVWPTRVVPFVAFAAPLLYTALTYSYFKSWYDQRWLAPYAYIMDWRDRSPNILYESPMWFGPVSLMGGALVACGVVLLMLGVLVARRGGWGVAVSCVAVAVVLVGTGRWMTQPSSAPFGVEAAGAQPVVNPPLVCAGDVVETCLHQVYERELVSTAAEVDAMFAPIAGLPAVPERIEQRADLESSEAVLRFDQTWTHEVLPDQSATYDLLWPVLATGTPVQEGGVLDAPQHVIARWLVMRSGAGHYYASVAAEVENPYRLAEQRHTGSGPVVHDVSEADRNAYFDALAAYNQEIAAAADRFATMPPAEQRAWLEVNWDALRAGDLTLEDLP